MKRTLAILLVATLLLPLVSCGGEVGSLAQEETETLIRASGEKPAQTKDDAGKHEVAGFSVGFGRQCISPATSVPLAGYGNDSYRLSEKILDDVYATCVAIQDEAGERILIFQMDMCYTTASYTTSIKNIVKTATGIPADRVFFTSTHTHSAPAAIDSSENWVTMSLRKVAQAAKDAIADLDACTGMYTGSVETDRLNFIRRYYRENGFVTDGADIGTGDITGHETKIDQEMRLVKFARKNQPDVVLVNWQCHPHRTGGSAATDVSSDIIGVMQKDAEKDLGVKTLFLQGGAGNINPTSRISSELRYSEYHQIGRALSDTMIEGLKNVTEVKTGAVRAETFDLEGNIDHSGEDRLEDANRVYALFTANDRSGGAALAAQLGFKGMYEAVALVNNSKRGATSNIHITCCAFGDVAITTAPLEMFCQTLKDVRERSPYAFTLTCGYTDGYLGYMPAKDCFANGGYEVWQCRFEPGTAEIIAAKQLEMLTELASQAASN